MAFLYPWGNTQQLNLDWILQKIKELESSGGADLDEVANALISASYAVQAYDRSDIVFRDGKLYRANQAIPAPGEVWTPAHWDEILLGDTVSNLVQYVAALRNDQIVNNSNVSGTHTSDALNNLYTAITRDTLHDTKTAILVDPASIDNIKGYDTGLYRIAIGTTTIFPHGYGILEIIKAQDYGVARFSNMNVPYPATWILQWNTNNGNWYINTWTDEQKYLKDLTAQLPVANGGTGAITAADARKNLGLCYAANDTETSNASNPIPGFLGTIANVARTLYLEFITEKSLENISTITVTALTGQLFGVAGALDGGTSADFTSGQYTATAVKLSNTRIRITITKASAFSNATASTPVVFWGSVSLKFT